MINLTAKRRSNKKAESEKKAKEAMSNQVKKILSDADQKLILMVRD